MVTDVPPPLPPLQADVTEAHDARCHGAAGGEGAAEAAPARRRAACCMIEGLPGIVRHSVLFNRRCIATQVGQGCKQPLFVWDYQRGSPLSPLCHFEREPLSSLGISPLTPCHFEREPLSSLCNTKRDPPPS